MGEKENILIVHNYYQISGGEDSVVVNEKRMLEDHGHKVTLYTRSNSELKEMSKIRKLLLPFFTVFNFRTYRDIRKIIKEQKIDIVHVHNTLTLVSASVYYAALSRKVPVVQTVHNFRLICPGATFYRNGHICEDCITYGLRCAVKHNCYRESRFQTLACVINTKIHRMTKIYEKINYICLTEFNKRKLLLLKQIKENRVFIKPNSVESMNIFIPGDKRKDQFVFAGRLDKLKGIDMLLHVWKQMGEDAPKLIICGTGTMEDWCKKFIKENRINAHLAGFMSNVEVRKLIATSKALILPTQCYEGFPISIVEAFSVGTPVICSDFGNAGSIVENGVCGYKFKNGRVEDIKLLINELKFNIKIYNSTQNIYQQIYNPEKNYEMLSNIYKNLS